MRHFYAHTDPRHSTPDESGAHWQLLHEHLLSVARLAESFAKDARADDAAFHAAARWSGLLHDLGKYTDAFQKMLRDEALGRRSTPAPHAVYGAEYAHEFHSIELALAVMGHHAGLPSLSELKEKFARRGAEFTPQDLVEKRAVLLDGLKELEQPVPAWRIPKSGKISFELKLRMLFSCLIDADRLDTARHLSGPEPTAPGLDSPALLKCLLSNIERRAAGVPDGTVKAARADVLRACLAAAETDSRRRLFSLTVPTGGGKTLASLAFALKRAAAHSNNIRRIIIVIPYLSIIEQNAGVLQEALGDDVILEHHSGDIGGLKTTGANGAEHFVSAEDEESEKRYSSSEVRRKISQENWDSPVIVTTSVRFFESLYSNRPSDLRRLHNIARSLVILDEIQTVPREFLGTLLSMMKGLAGEWNTQFLFCTATQPAFEKHSTASDDDMRWEKGEIREIAPDTRRLFAELKRVEVTWPAPGERLQWDDVAVQMLEGGRALCVVNVKKHALELYQRIQAAVQERGWDAARVHHLSTRMCAAHRLAKIQQIKAHLTEIGKPCIVVSTQLIEAGVDLDFPIVYRAMGPFDSIAQAAGRCDREGLLTAAAGHPAGRVVVFRPEDDASPPGGYREATQMTESLLGRGEPSIYDPKHIQRYFHELYAGEQDRNNIEAMRDKFDFPAVAEQFKMIEDCTQAVLVPYGVGAQIIEHFRNAPFITRQMYRCAQRFQVGLYPHEFLAAQKVGAIELIRQDDETWGCNSLFYSDEIGLDFIAPVNPERLHV